MQLYFQDKISYVFRLRTVAIIRPVHLKMMIIVFTWGGTWSRVMM